MSEPEKKKKRSRVSKTKEQRVKQQKDMYQKLLETMEQPPIFTVLPHNIFGYMAHFFSPSAGIHLLQTCKILKLLCERHLPWRVYAHELMGWKMSYKNDDTFLRKCRIKWLSGKCCFGCGSSSRILSPLPDTWVPYYVQATGRSWLPTCWDCCDEKLDTINTGTAKQTYRGFEKIRDSLEFVTRSRGWGMKTFWWLVPMIREKLAAQGEELSFEASSISSSDSPAPPIPQEDVMRRSPEAKVGAEAEGGGGTPCPSCTFLNEGLEAACEMCGAAMVSRRARPRRRSTWRAAKRKKTYAGDDEEGEESAGSSFEADEEEEEQDDNDDDDEASSYASD